jgi:processive 1,2-diacylglycerol beta-glucosyltransferase
MYKNILIISSDQTGHGHKSITEALIEQFNKYEQVKVHIIDGYSLSGSIGLKIGKLYGTITRASNDLWKMIWDISLKRPDLIIDLVENSIQERLQRKLKQINPDAILVTHPNYNSSVLNILENNNIKIPLFDIVADPVSISPLWSDARAKYTICPTEEAKKMCMGHGVPESRIKVFGFPVREKFCNNEVSNDPIKGYNFGKPLRCLIMSGGEGSGNMSRTAKILLKNFNCSIRIICGRNKQLKTRLEHTLLEKYPGNVEIIGFSDNIQEHMLDSDVLFARASPNVMMEAVMCNVPLIITGALPGQEEGNPAYAEKYGLGVVCHEIKDIKQIMDSLLDNNAELLQKIKTSQLKYRNPKSAANIVEFILNN